MLNANHFRWPLVAGLLFSLLAVVMGAFTAHALKSVLDEYALSIIDTAARYQMYHGLGLIGCMLLAKVNLARANTSIIAAICMTIGVVLFSGSLYFLALSGAKWLGFITPIGGLFLLAGWVLLLIAVFQIKPVEASSYTETITNPVDQPPQQSELQHEK